MLRGHTASNANTQTHRKHTHATEAKITFEKMCFGEVFNHSGIKPQRINGRQHPQTRGCSHTPKEGEKVLTHEKAGKRPRIPQWQMQVSHVV